MARSDSLRVCVASFESPEAPTTWSRTPFNLVEAFKKKNAYGGAVRVKIAYGLVPFLWLLNCLFAPRFRFLYNYRDCLPLTYRLHGFFTTWKIRRTGADCVLHCAADFRIPERRKVRRPQFAYIDSTFYDWNMDAKVRRSHPELLPALETASIENLRRADHLFVTGPHVKRILSQRYAYPEAKVTVVGSGRGRLSPFFGSKDYRQLRLLFVAKQRFESKGGLVLLEAFKMLLADPAFANASLDVVGGQEFASRYADVERVRFHDFVSDRDLQELFHQATLFVMPAINEPWGLVYLEALVCKVPIVGLKTHAVPELSQNGRFGFLLDEATPEAVCSILREAASDPKRLSTMGAQGQAHCLDYFTWEKTAERMLAVMSRLVDEARGS